MKMKRTNYLGTTYEYDYKMLTVDSKTHEKIKTYAQKEDVKMKDFITHIVRLYENKK